MKATKVLGWVLAILGAWMIAAPFVWGYAAQGVTSDVIAGVIWVVFGLWIALTEMGDAIKLLGWLSALLGVLVMFAPGILGYGQILSALWNDLIMGFLGMVLGAWAAYNAPEGTTAPQPASHH